MNEIINVNCNDDRYDVVIQEDVFLNNDFNNLDFKRVLIITETNVYGIYKQKLKEQKLTVFCVSGGEENKNYSTVESIIEYLLETKYDRHDLLIAFGGGIIGDVVGFVAATYMRGISYYNIPTTLLAQVDSSIGGKVAINFKDKKNIVGYFNNPNKVFVDQLFLNTLDDNQLYNGLVEVIKIGLILDEELFEYLYKTKELDYNYLIKQSVNLKKMVVEKDFKEQHERKLLNYGHTIGHAIELYYNIDHGYAVAHGIEMMLRMYGTEDTYQKYLVICKRYSLLSELKIDGSVFELILNDKKSNGNNINLVVVKTAGDSEIITMNSNEFINRLRSEYASPNNSK